MIPVARGRRREVERVLRILELVHGRPRPSPRSDPLDDLISTILSQSTSDTNSHRAFALLKEAFPDWQAVLRAPAARIERAIRSGGLARIKSVRIKRVLREVLSRRGSLDLRFLHRAPVEQGLEFLMSLPGVGPKTAACVLLFACRRAVFPADTHILRIARRLGWLPQRMNDLNAHALLGALIPEDRIYAAHINLIRHGRTICHARHPQCDRCPLLEYCDFGQGSE